MQQRNFPVITCSLILFLWSGVIGFGQDHCKVLLPSISGSYSGKCKKGLAHGKGTAIGTDTYVGRFSKGLPDGKGEYRWADGRVYEGSWSRGMKAGKGTMTYPRTGGDSVVTGIWKDDIYAGAIPVPVYQINQSRSVPRYSIRKINETGNGVRIGLYLGGSFNSEIEDFSLASDTGEKYEANQRYCIDNAIVPYKVTIRYKTWNYFHTEQHDVVFEFTINEPGIFEVTINN